MTSHVYLLLVYLFFAKQNSKNIINLDLSKGFEAMDKIIAKMEEENNEEMPGWGVVGKKLDN